MVEHPFYINARPKFRVWLWGYPLIPVIPAKFSRLSGRTASRPAFVWAAACAPGGAFGRSSYRDEQLALDQTRKPHASIDEGGRVPALPSSAT